MGLKIIPEKLGEKEKLIKQNETLRREGDAYINRQLKYEKLMIESLELIAAGKISNKTITEQLKSEKSLMEILECLVKGDGK